MRSLTILSYLIDYPDQTLWDMSAPLIEAIEKSADFTSAQKQSLVKFIETYLAMDLLDAQEQYHATFDVGSSTSLLLFEHIHGDSRERGQAMVDLLVQYEQSGLTITENQLPDYLPLFLEYAAHLPTEEAIHWLKQIAVIIRLLALRLAKRESEYEILFNLLFELSGEQADEVSLQNKIMNEQADNTPQALDTIWQEEQVLFNAGSACDSSVAQPLQTQSKTSTYYVNVGEDKRI
ncbi:nitrate reductase molybdenum cofactor assembly chaperone [Utexia brackfieldae]|uniref:nitrate reductase molybdenum cofactor assembly chaperone n=1 Tax=Utexia brackfieldae TaxID=3074108 RepID=UPI00370D88AB